MKKILCLLVLSCSGVYAANDAYLRYMQGLLAERAGDLNTALSEYEKVVTLDPKAREVYRDIAQLQLRKGDADAALKAAEKAKELAPEDPNSFLFLGNIYVARGDLAKAADAYEKVLKLDPKDLRALENLGNYYILSNPVKALGYFQRYLELQPQDPTIHFQIGYLLQRKGDLKAAEAAYKKSLEMDSSQLAPRLALAEMYEIQKSTQAALDAYASALEEEPKNAALFIKRGHLYYQNKQWDEAISEFENAKVLRPDDVAIYYWLARTAEEKNDLDKAIQNCQKAYEISREPQFLPLLGYYLTLKKRPKEAVYWLEIAQKTDKTSPNIYLLLGMGYLELNQLDKARATLEKGCELHPKDAQLRFQLAISKDKSGDFDAAIKTFKQVLEIDPKNAAALNYIGYSYADRGIQLEEAEKMIRSAVQLDEDNPAFLDSLGWVRFKRGDYAEAIFLLEKTALLSDDATIYDHLAQARLQNKDVIGAVAAWEKSLALKKDPAIEKKLVELRKSAVSAVTAAGTLKRMQASAEILETLQASAQASGKAYGQRLKGMVRLQARFPDKIEMTFLLPSGETYLELRLDRGQLTTVPADVDPAWKTQGVADLTKLLDLFSGRFFGTVQKDVTGQSVAKNILTVSTSQQNLWIDLSQERLTRLEKPSGKKREEWRLDDPTLKDGVWLPKSIRLSDPSRQVDLRLKVSSWTVGKKKK